MLPVMAWGSLEVRSGKGASSLHRCQIAGEVTAEKAQIPLISPLSPGIKAKYSSQHNLLLHLSRLIRDRRGDRPQPGGNLSAPLGHPTVNRKISREKDGGNLHP